MPHIEATPGGYNPLVNPTPSAADVAANPRVGEVISSTSPTPNVFGASPDYAGGVLGVPTDGYTQTVQAAKNDPGTGAVITMPISTEDMAKAAAKRVKAMNLFGEYPGY